MFNEIGGKLKGLAYFVAIAGIVASIISGVFVMRSAIPSAGAYGIICMVVGSLASWISSWVIYALGEISNDLKSVKAGQMGLKGAPNFAGRLSSEVLNKRPEDAVRITPALKEILAEAKAIDDDNQLKAYLKEKRKELEKAGNAKEADILYFILNSPDRRAAIYKYQ